MRLVILLVTVAAAGVAVAERPRDTVNWLLIPILAVRCVAPLTSSCLVETQIEGDIVRQALAGGDLQGCFLLSLSCRSSSLPGLENASLSVA